MRTRNNLYWGAFLVVIGLIFLGINYNFVDFNYTLVQIARFWPVLLILAGLAVLFNKNRSFYNPLTAIFVAFAIPLALFSVVSKGVDHFKNRVENEWHFEWGEENEKGGGEENSGQVDGRKPQHFSIPLKAHSEKVKLNVNGGAAEFLLSESTSNLFAAKTLLTGWTFQVAEEVKGGQYNIDFEMKNKGKNDLNFRKFQHNEVSLMLHKKPIWDINLEIGAGDLDFDMSNYKVERLEINTGVASVDVKLGSLLDKVDVTVESGVAKVELEIPEEVGCQIIMDGALSSKDFDGFSKIEDSIYQTDNFNTARKKIFIKVSSGLSSVSINRY